MYISFKIKIKVFIMNITEIFAKYGLKQADINKITTCMLENKGIKQTVVEISGKINEKQLFVVASAIANAIFETPIDEMCPAMTLERLAMNEESKEVIQRNNFINGEIKKFALIKEDLAFLKLEIRSRAA